jgi:hypothetical protein
LVDVVVVAREQSTNEKLRRAAKRMAKNRIELRALCSTSGRSPTKPKG